eukprot:2197817-Rhodomonas_salina.1
MRRLNLRGGSGQQPFHDDPRPLARDDDELKKIEEVLPTSREENDAGCWGRRGRSDAGDLTGILTVRGRFSLRFRVFGAMLTGA